MLFNLQDYVGAGGGNFGLDPTDPIAAAFGGLGVAADPLRQSPLPLGMGRFLQPTNEETRRLRARDASGAPPLDPSFASPLPPEAPEVGPQRRTPTPAQAALLDRFGIPRSREEAGLPPAGAPPRQAPPALTREQLGLTPPLDQFNNARQSPEIPASQPLAREAFGLVPEQAPAPREVGPGSARGSGLSFAGQAKGGDGESAPKAGQPSSGVFPHGTFATDPPLPPQMPAAVGGQLPSLEPGWERTRSQRPIPTMMGMMEDGYMDIGPQGQTRWAGDAGMRPEVRAANAYANAYANSLSMQGLMPLGLTPGQNAMLSAQRAEIAHQAGLAASGRLDDSKFRLQEMVGQQAMQQLQAQLAAQEKIAQGHNANALAVAEMAHRPNPQALRSDFGAKLLANSWAADPSGNAANALMDSLAQSWPKMESVFFPAQAQGPQLAAERPGYGGQPPPAGPTPAAGAPTDRDLVMRMMNDMRNVAAKTTQTPEGATQYEFNRDMAEQSIPRLAQMYQQYNLNPQQKAEFLRQLGMNQRGGLGDLGAIREAAAIQAAKAYLQAKNFGRDLMSNGGYPETLAIPDPSNPARTLATLGSAPHGQIGRMFADAREQLLNNLSEDSGTAVMPYEQITVPGRGTLPFPRGDVRPTFGQAAAKQKATRDLDALLRFYADIAHQQPR